MKHLIPILLLFTLSPFHPFTLSAAVPLKWTVETSRAQPATFDEFAGATYDLEATLQTYGKPLEVVGDPHLYFQTNGMGSVYWSVPASVSGNVLRATWTPACDVGARAYNCFIGITGTVYNAAFQLRLRPSPGAVPNELPLPQKVIDFSQVTVLNPPWSGGGSGGVDTNAVIDIALTPATNYTDRATGEVIRLVGALADEKRDKTDLAVYAVHENSEWVPDAHGQTLGLPGQPYIEWYGDENPGRYFAIWGNYVSYDNGPEDETITFTLSEPEDEFTAHKSVRREVQPTSDRLATTDDLTSAISTNNPAFVSAVQSIAPPSPPSLRLYDAARDCFWIGRMVDGVITWEVEE